MKNSPRWVSRFDEVCSKKYAGQEMMRVIVFLAVVLCSCTTERQPEVATEVKTFNLKKTELIPDIKEPGRAENPPVEPPDVEVSLKFEGLTITTLFDEIWSKDDYLSQVHTDTILIQLGLGDDLAEKTYVVRTDSSIRSIEVFQNYETSLTLMNEGPHIDLTDWKHYVSDWKKLDVSDNTFRTLDYSRSYQRKFPEVTTEEIVRAVKEYLGTTTDDEWIALAGKCKGADHYPCGISLSRINLKIVLTAANGTKTEKLVIFEIPMGC